MADYIEEFALPNPDWYDEKGRIYKDALILNFNALEDKLNEIAKLGALEINVPSWTDVSIEDTDVHTSPDNAVVNLRTLVETLRLVNFPFNIEFVGKVCKNLYYYNSAYELIRISNVELTNLNDTNKYIFLNVNNNNLYATDNYLSSDVFVGILDKGVVNTNNSPDFCDINALSMLAKMGIETQTKNIGSSKSTRSTRNVWMNGRLRANYQINTDSPNISFTHYDLGRKGSNERG